MLSECKYYIIALIIVIFLICIFYPPFSTTDCDTTNHDTSIIESTEGFSPLDIPTPDDIRITAEAAALKLSERTYNFVIYPCEQISNPVNITVCISGYNQYFENIIKEPVADMYTALKQLDDKPHYQNLAFKRNVDEEYWFTVEMTNAYTKALITAVNYIQANYGFEGFDQVVFIYAFQEFLRKLLSQAIVNVYRGTDTLNQIRENRPDDQTQLQETAGNITSTPINTETSIIPSHETETIIRQSVMEEITNYYNIDENKSHDPDMIYLDCAIRNNKTRVYIDGMRLSCD